MGKSRLRACLVVLATGKINKAKERRWGEEGKEMGGGKGDKEGKEEAQQAGAEREKMKNQKQKETIVDEYY